MRCSQTLSASGAASRTDAIVTYRDSDLSRTHPLTALLADLWRLPRVHRLTLIGLTGDDIVELITAAAGYDIGAEGEALAQALGAETAGNPFFLTELVKLLVSEGSLGSRASAESAPVPAGVREVIRRRLAHLPEQTKALLSVAAIIYGTNLLNG